MLDADSAAILLLGDDDELGSPATLGSRRALEQRVAIPLGAGMAGVSRRRRASP